MIETRQLDLDFDKVRRWTDLLLPQLTPDVSNYARGRMRAWLGLEPSLSTYGVNKPGLPLSIGFKNRLQDLIEWEFDYCLVTYSGNKAIGITPHRDASALSYEAIGLNLLGECEFSYWNDRRSFEKAPSSGLAPQDKPPTDVIQMTPGTLVRFNTKNLHSAAPQAHRWGINFWKAK